MTNALDQLRAMTTVVADTGDLEAVKRYQPVDCTTNPSLVLKAFDNPESEAILTAAISDGKAAGKTAEQLGAELPVALGVELTKLVPGRVSTEVDAHLSFDADASIARAHDIIEAYDKRGVDKSRILIKLAATWEGVQACEVLQKEGIDCNLTLIFNQAQAIACADAGAFLISPFVGRITDWFKKAKGVDGFAAEEDPGVLSVCAIYDYYKSNSIDTIVMGASFRNKEQIIALAGCDNLTISPALLDELEATDIDLARALDAANASGAEKVDMAESKFRWETTMDPMANELLANGIRGFNADYGKMIAKIAG